MGDFFRSIIRMDFILELSDNAISLAVLFCLGYMLMMMLMPVSIIQKKLSGRDDESNK